MLVVEFPWASFEVKMAFTCRIFQHERRTISKEKIGMNNPSILKIKNEGKCTQEHAIFFLTRKKTFDR